MRPVTILPIAALAAAALASPAPAAAEPDASFLHLGAPKPVLSGDEAASAPAARRGHEGHIEVQSYAFGAARKGSDGTVKGGKVVESADAASRKGWDGTVKGSGSSAAPADQGAKFGAIAGAHRHDGLAGPAAASTAKTAQPKPIAHDLRTNVVARLAAPAAPPAPGSITVDGNFPGCTVGAAYADAMLQLAGVRYELADVQITSCPAAAATLGAGRTADSLSLNYRKVKVRAWDPEKKED